MVPPVRSELPVEVEIPDWVYRRFDVAERDRVGDEGQSGLAASIENVVCVG